MDDSNFQSSDDDLEEPSPSMDDIVTAFRIAAGRTQEQSDPGRGESHEDGGLDTQTETNAEPVYSPSMRADMVEDTLAAFRRARRQSQEDKEIELPGREAPTPQARERSDRPEQTDRSPDEELSTSSAPDLNIEDPLEDFAPAFRKALERRSRSAENDAENEARSPAASDRERDDSVGQEAHSAPVSSGPGTETGDGIPSVEEVEVSESESPGASNRPVQADASFLWVTDESEEDASAVSIDQLNQRRAQEADALLLSGSARNPYEQLARIRGHSNLHVFLKPVFLQQPAGEESTMAQHVDGVWTQGEQRELEALKETASSINGCVDDMVGSEARAAGGMELRVLRFMATRNHTFEPHWTVQNADGFIYPRLSPLLDREGRRGGAELIQILSMLEERRLLTGEFVTYQHACQGCGCAFLNFEERCPNCGATHLDTQDLVHHFQCAFTGPLSDYKKEEGRLVCPKCDRFLKQIGVDYDKPSVVHTCQRCQERFQEPEVQTTCYQCGRTSPPEQQVRRQVKSYKVTALGEETAIYGLSDSLLSILERESRLLDYSTFQLIVESEAARIERYQRSTASLLLVQVTGLQGLRRELGQRSQEVIEELATAFDNTLRASDYLSARHESLYLFLLTETDESGARQAGERLEQNLEGVLDENLEVALRLEIGVEPLLPGADLDDIAEDFLSSGTREWSAVGP